MEVLAFWIVLMELSKPKLNACLALKVAKSVPLEKIATIVNKIYFGVRV